VGTSGSGFCGGLGLAWLSSGCEQGSEPVVGQASEASAGAFDVFGFGVGCFGSAVVGAG